MCAGAATDAPNPGSGDGQYILVLKGTLRYEGREYGAWSVAFVDASEQTFRIEAGDEGLQALILSFPGPACAISG